MKQSLSVTCKKLIQVSKRLLANRSIKEAASRQGGSASFIDSAMQGFFTTREENGSPFYVNIVM